MCVFSKPGFQADNLKCLIKHKFILQTYLNTIPILTLPAILSGMPSSTLLGNYYNYSE